MAYNLLKLVGFLDPRSNWLRNRAFFRAVAKQARKLPIAPYSNKDLRAPRYACEEGVAAEISSRQHVAPSEYS